MILNDVMTCLRCVNSFLKNSYFYYVNITKYYVTFNKNDVNVVKKFLKYVSES